MSSVDYGNAPRLQASEVALNPAVAGNTNVQDALDDPGGTGAGFVVLAEQGDDATADDTATVPLDGSTHPVSCVLAAPPTWMDDAGNIITSGLYQFVVRVLPGVAATTPGDVIVLSDDAAALQVSIDGLATRFIAVPMDLINVAASNVPFPTEVVVSTPTDATATVQVVLKVVRLVYNAGTDPPA